MNRAGLMVLLFLVGVVEVMGVNPVVTPLPPPVTPARGTPGTTTGHSGGYYETETQVFHEDLAVVGVPFVLHYSSRRVPGYGPGQAVYVNGVGEGNGMTKVSVGLLPGVVGAGLDEADLPVGLRLVEGAPEGHSLSYVIRPEAGLMWPEAVTVVLRYDWEITDGTHEASLPGVMKRIPMCRTVCQQAAVGTVGAQSSGLGGWSPDIQHAYCPGNQTLYTGSGQMIKLDGGVQADSNGECRVVSVAGDEIYVFSHGGRRHEQTLDRLTGVERYRFGYDDQGRLVRVVDGDGNATVIERSAEGLAQAIVAPRGQRTELNVVVSTGLELLVQLVNPAGETNTMTYSAGGLMTSIHSRRGYEFLMGYDGEGRLAEVRIPGEGVQVISRVVLTQEDPAVESTFGVWAAPFVVRPERRGDPNRSLVRVTTGEGVVREYGMDVSPEGAVQFREWEKFDWRWVSGIPTNVAAPAVARRVLAPRLVSTNREEDGTIMVVATGPDPVYGWQAPVATQGVVSTPAGLRCVTEVVRTASGGTLGEQVRVNGETVYTAGYEASSRMITTTLPGGYEEKTTLDESGRVARVDRPGVYPVSVRYDGEGRPVRFEQGTGEVSRVMDLGYAPGGFLQAVTNALGEGLWMDRDAVGRSTNVVLADGRCIGLRYDRSEQPVGVTPPGRVEHVQGYTAIGRMGSYQPPSITNGSGGETWTYNRDREVSGMVRADGSVITNVYDATGRLSRVTWPEGSVDLVRDTAHRVVGVQGGDGSRLSYSWDGFLPLSESWTGAVSGRVSRTYDSRFRTVAVTVGGGPVTGYQYDLDGAVSRAGDLMVNRDHQTGFMTNSVLGAITETLAVDGFGEVVHREAKAGDTGLYAVEYGFDRLGRVTNKTETVGGETNWVAYQYDSAGRLAGVSGTDAQGSYVNAYSYDANGNRTQSVVRGLTSTGVVDGQDRLLGSGGVSYHYGATGTLTNKVDGAGRATALRYDARGVLLGVARQDSPVVDYVLDPLGRRVGKKMDGVRVRGWLYANGLKPVAELDGSNNVVSVFVYGTSGLTPDYLVKGGIQYRMIRDHLGSVRLVVNAQTGAVVQRLDYDEWGRVTQDTNPGFQPFGFAGGMYDADTGLVRFGARDYDPETGRWTARDPILFNGGQVNLYVYCANNPVNFIDPLGLLTWSQVGNFAGGVAIGAGVAIVVVVAAPVVASAGAAALVAAGVSAATAGTIATATVTAGLGAGAAWGVGSTAGHAVGNAEAGNWDAVAFDAGTLAGGFAVGGLGGGRAMAGGVSGRPSTVPESWNFITAERGYGYVRNPNLNPFVDRFNWLATGPTPSSAGGSAALIGSGVIMNLPPSSVQSPYRPSDCGGK